MNSALKLVEPTREEVYVPKYSEIHIRIFALIAEINLAGTMKQTQLWAEKILGDSPNIQKAKEYQKYKYLQLLGQISTSIPQIIGNQPPLHFMSPKQKEVALLHRDIDKVRYIIGVYFG